MRSFIERKFTLLVIFSIIVRVIAVLVSPEIADAKNAHTVAETFLNSGVLYQTKQIYPYPPLWIIYMVFSVYIEKILFIPFVYLIKLPAVLADISLIFILSKLFKKKTPVLVYALNPIVIIVSSVFGKEDPVMILAVFLALLLLQKNKSMLLSAVLFGLSVWLKTFTILFLPLFLMKIKNNYDRLKFTLVVLIPFAAMLIPFVLKDYNVINKVYFSYVGSADYGWLASFKALSGIISGTSINFTPINDRLFQFLSISKYLFLAIYFFFLVYLEKIQKKGLLLSMVLTFLLFFIVYGGIGTNFLFWIVPFLTLYNYKISLTFTILGFPVVIFYILSQFYEPVLKNFDLFFLKTPVFLNFFYFATALLFWVYLVFLFFKLLTQNNSKANMGR